MSKHDPAAAKPSARVSDPDLRRWPVEWGLS